MALKGPDNSKPEPKPKIPKIGQTNIAPKPQIPPRVMDKALERNNHKHPADKPVRRKKRQPGPLPQLAMELYLRGIPKSQVQINGPQSTIDQFNKYCEDWGLKKWEAIQIMLDGVDPAS